MSIASPADVRARLEGVAMITADGLEVHDEGRLRGELMDELAVAAVFGTDDVRDAARWVIWAASQAVGCPSASIHELYLARGRGEFDPTRFTVPAINVRAATYLTAREAFAAALERDAGTVIFEIAKSEMAYTDQRPAEYAAVVLAAAMRSGWRGPVFLQGDHFQFNATKWASAPGPEMEGIRDLTREAIAAGFLNIDIDSSTLVDLALPTVAEQQRVNADNTAALTRLIRELEPAGVTISVGGEIGEVGKSNSTEAELRAYLDAYRAALGPDLPGISKVSIQTGTSHGGVPMPDGSMAKVNIDFDALDRLSRVARDDYGLAGCVQHGASTLPADAFDHFPDHGTAEVHLATGFQNILYDSGGLPGDLRAEMMAWCLANCADERKEGETDEQFMYRTRKKAIGPFKERLWNLPAEATDAIAADMRAQFSMLFDKLGIAGTRTLVERYVTVVPVARQLPVSLGGGDVAAVTAGAAVFEDDGSGE